MTGIIVSQSTIDELGVSFTIKVVRRMHQRPLQIETVFIDFKLLLVTGTRQMFNVLKAMLDYSQTFQTYIDVATSTNDIISAIHMPDYVPPTGLVQFPEHIQLRP